MNIEHQGHLNHGNVCGHHEARPSSLCQQIEECSPQLYIIGLPVPIKEGTRLTMRQIPLERQIIVPHYRFGAVERSEMVSNKEEDGVCFSMEVPSLVLLQLEIFIRRSKREGQLQQEDHRGKRTHSHLCYRRPLAWLQVWSKLWTGPNGTCWHLDLVLLLPIINSPTFWIAQDWILAMMMLKTVVQRRKRIPTYPKSQCGG